MADEMASLTLTRLHGLISGAFRLGLDTERAGTITTTEQAYAHSEHHARVMVREFTAVGFIAVTVPPAQEDGA